MKTKFTLLITLLLLALSACGNPIEQVQERVAQEVTEKIAEEITGAGNIEFEEGEDGSVSITVEDENGESVFSSTQGEDGSISIAVEGEDGEIVSSTTAEEENLEAITAMGFTLNLPTGLSEAAVQRITEGDQEIMVNASFTLSDISRADFNQAMHDTLTQNGFTFVNPMNDGATQPDSANPTAITIYQHTDGFQFSIMGDEENVLLGLTNADDASTSGEATGETSETTNPSAPIPTTLDGSMLLDKTSYTAGETIEVTLLINTPLADDAWVGLIPSDTPHGLEADSDAVDLDYEYVSRAVDGKVTFTAPSEPGAIYDIRLFNTDASDGVELASETFTITE